MKKKLDKFVGLLREHIIFSMIVSSILGVIFTWLFGWILPTKPVEVGNLPKKELTSIVNFSENLIYKNTNNEKFQILYDGEIVESPYIYNITIENTGIYEISNEDFKEYFVIEFEGCDKIVNAEVINSTNKEIYVEVVSNLKVEDNKLIFKDFFLNPNEAFTFNVITDSKVKTIVYDYRIAGISNLIIKNMPKEKVYNIRNVGLLFCSCISIFAFLSLIWLIVQIKKSKQLNNQYIEYIKKTMEESQND